MPDPEVKDKVQEQIPDISDADFKEKTLSFMQKIGKFFADKEDEPEVKFYESDWLKLLNVGQVIKDPWSDEITVYTQEVLQNIADNYNENHREREQTAYLFIGHDFSRTRFAYGQIQVLSVFDGALQYKLEQVPQEVFDWLKLKLFRTVSAEISLGMKDMTMKVPTVTGIALLGADAPAIANAKITEADLFGEKSENKIIATLSEDNEVKNINNSEVTMPENVDLQAKIDQLEKDKTELTKGRDLLLAEKQSITLSAKIDQMNGKIEKLPPVLKDDLQKIIIVLANSTIDETVKFSNTDGANIDVVKVFDSLVEKLSNVELSEKQVVDNKDLPSETEKAMAHWGSNKEVK